MVNNTNIEDRSFNANVDPTTRQGNTFDGLEAPPDPVLREGPQDQPQEVVEDQPTQKEETVTNDNGAQPGQYEEYNAFDPADYKVSEVKQWVRDHPDERETVRDAESEGKARSTLLSWLEDEEDEDDEEVEEE